MTYLSGIRVLNEGRHRLFDPLHRILIIADGIGIALMAVQSHGRFNIEGRYGTFQCTSFPMAIKFPLLMPTLAMANGTPMTEIGFEFGPIPSPDPPPGKKQTIVKNYGHSVLHALTPIYVDFYEKHRRWLRAKFGGDPNAWPALFNFARAIRNFISHSSGCVDFENPNAPPVSWHHLSYSPADVGKRVIGTDIQIGELVILLFELGDELDRLGCPLDP